MKDYIKMTVLARYSEKVDLVSEVFEDNEDCQHFANCFSHNYNCGVSVCSRTGKGCVVFAYDVPIYLLKPNIDERTNAGEFANWIFEARHFTNEVTK